MPSFLTCSTIGPSSKKTTSHSTPALCPKFYKCSSLGCVKCCLGSCWVTFNLGACIVARSIDKYSQTTTFPDVTRIKETTIPSIPSAKAFGIAFRIIAKRSGRLKPHYMLRYTTFRLRGQSYVEQLQLTRLWTTPKYTRWLFYQL